MSPQEMFPSRPTVTAYLPWEDKSGLWYFEFPFVFTLKRGAGVIPAGFETDFGSVPAWLRSFVDDDDPQALCPFVVHDKRYNDAIGPRAQWDEELYENCIACGMSRVKAWIIYRAVRLGGGSHYQPKPAAT